MNQPHCSDEQLRFLLQSKEENWDIGIARSDYCSATLGHIDVCPLCQARLEQLAAEPAEWDAAKESLLASDTDESELKAAAIHQKLWVRNRCSFHVVTWTDSIAQQLLSPPSHSEMLGRIGRYDVERLIGSGGMGVVFKAFDTELNRPVAVKLLSPYLAGSGPARKRFTREARAAAAVVHEHVVAIHKVESEGASPFLVMPFVAGESLQQRIDRVGPLGLCEVLRIAMQTASGLAAAHSQGLVHRDVKPSNILLELGVERALLPDFSPPKKSQSYWNNVSHMCNSQLR